MPLQSSQCTCLFCSDFLFFRGRGALYKYQVRLDKIRSVERPKIVNRSLEKGGRGWRVGEARKQSRFFKREILLYFSTFIKATNPVEYCSRAEPSRHDDSVHLQQRKNILFPWCFVPMSEGEKTRTRVLRLSSFINWHWSTEDGAGDVACKGGNSCWTSYYT